MTSKSSGSTRTTRRTTTRRTRRTADAEPVNENQTAAVESEEREPNAREEREPKGRAAEPKGHAAEEERVNGSGTETEVARQADDPLADWPDDLATGTEPRESADDDQSSSPARRRRRRRRRRGGGDRHETNGTRTQEPRGRGRRDQQQHQQYQQRERPRHPRSAADGGAEVTGVIEGVLELHPKGYGFLRDPQKNYISQDSDAFVSSTVIEKYRLREGVLIRGEVGPGSRGQGPRLKSVETVDGRSVDEYQQIKLFEDLTPINPFEQIKLETGPRPITMRVMDLLTPIGKGQRALIVAPPRSGKTMLMQDIADSVSENHPEIHLMVLLIDERPEEVTELRRRVKGEVISSSMDREVESHVRISQLIFERARRLAESGKDVLVLLDSVTRTARAFNKWIGSSGKTGTGGLDVRAMDIPRKMFGTARRFDEGGSLTVVATALIDTGSRMDDAIFQEFKGTGNMELVLSRDLADRRIWPAIDISQSGTRREEKILSADVLEGVTMLRRSLVSLHPVEAMEQLVRTLERFPTNAEFLGKIRSIL